VAVLKRELDGDRQKALEEEHYSHDQTLPKPSSTGSCGPSNSIERTENAYTCQNRKQ
jgi:hypothetical protein